MSESKEVTSWDFPKIISFLKVKYNMVVMSCGSIENGKSCCVTASKSTNLLCEIEKNTETGESTFCFSILTSKGIYKSESFDTSLLDSEQSEAAAQDCYLQYRKCKGVTS